MKIKKRTFMYKWLLIIFCHSSHYQDAGLPKRYIHKIVLSSLSISLSKVRTYTQITGGLKTSNAHLSLIVCVTSVSDASINFCIFTWSPRPLLISYCTSRDFISFFKIKKIIVLSLSKHVHLGCIIFTILVLFDNCKDNFTNRIH